MCTDVLNFFPFRFGFVVVSMYCRSPLPPPPPPPTTFESPSFIPHLYLYYSSNGIQRTVDAHFQLFFHFYYSPFAFSFQFLFTFFSSSRWREFFRHFYIGEKFVHIRFVQIYLHRKMRSDIALRYVRVCMCWDIYSRSMWIYLLFKSISLPLTHFYFPISLWVGRKTILKKNMNFYKWNSYIRGENVRWSLNLRNFSSSFPHLII